MSFSLRSRMRGSTFSHFDLQPVLVVYDSRPSNEHSSHRVSEITARSQRSEDSVETDFHRNRNPHFGQRIARQLQADAPMPSRVAPIGTTKAFSRSGRADEELQAMTTTAMTTAERAVTAKEVPSFHTWPVRPMKDSFWSCSQKLLSGDMT